MSVGEILKWVGFIRKVIECLTESGVISHQTATPLTNGAMAEITRSVVAAVQLEEESA